MKPNWSEGDVLPAVELPPVTRLKLIKYAGASGDYNPIHTVDEAAKEAGLPGVIAHGMLTAATLGNLLSECLDSGYIRELYVRFAGMVFVGDVVTVEGKVGSIREAESRKTYALDVVARRGEDIVASGSLEFMEVG